MGLNDSDFCGCILADEMGLGKTFSSITLIWTMIKQSPQGGPAANKVVIVAPSSLVGNWKREFKKWLGMARCRPLAVTQAGKAAEAVVDDFCISSSAVYPVLIISYEVHEG